jgi:hypothetical protein
MIASVPRPGSDPLPGTSLACGPCRSYVDRRGHVLAPEIAAAARRRSLTYDQVAEAYVEGVHQRHLAGLSIEFRPRLTIGRIVALLGQIGPTDAELDAWAEAVLAPTTSTGPVVYEIAGES